MPMFHFCFKDIVELVVGRVSVGHRVCREAYAMRLRTSLSSAELSWLRNDFTIRRVIDTYKPVASGEDLRYPADLFLLCSSRNNYL